MQSVVGIHPDIARAAEIIAHRESFYSSKVEVSKGAVGTREGAGEVPYLNHVAQLLIEGFQLEAGRLGEHLLEPNGVVHGLLRAQVWIGNQLVTVADKEIVNGTKANIGGRTLSQDVVVGKEDGLVRNVEREGHPRHQVDLRLVIAEGA